MKTRLFLYQGTFFITGPQRHPSISVDELLLWGREGEQALGRCWSFQGRCPGRKGARGRQGCPGAGVGSGGRWSWRRCLSILPVLTQSGRQGGSPPVTPPPSLLRSESAGLCHVTPPLDAVLLLLCLTFCDLIDCSTPGSSNCCSLSSAVSRSLLKFMSVASVMLSNHLILCRLLLPLLSTFPSISVFSSELALCIRWPKTWSFSFSISPSNEYSGLISFRTDRFDLHSVQGTLKSLLQQSSSKASILLCSAFFMVQLSHPYTTTGKTIALTRWTFVTK